MTDAMHWSKLDKESTTSLSFFHEDLPIVRIVPERYRDLPYLRPPLVAT